MHNQRVVFVTGAASGIGLEIAKSFAAAGAKVVLSDLNKEEVTTAAASLKEQGLEAIGLCCDVANEADLEQTLNRAREIYGPIEILINNAGLQFISPIEEFPSNKFELLIKVMLIAPFFTIKHVFPDMKARKWGRIINMASINGLVGFAGKAAYNSAKHGVIGLTKVAALEGAEFGITVNAICPGYVDTPLVQNQLQALAKTRNVPLASVLEEVIYPLVPQKRLLSVGEIADYVMFLAGDLAPGVTGQAVVIDGGYTVQ